MLTPNELKKTEFKKAMLGGYTATEVDAYIIKIISEYERLYSENAELSKKLELALDRIEGYSYEAESIKSAVMSAQKVCDNIIKEAEAKAQVIITDATIKSERLIKQSEAVIEDKKLEFVRIKNEVTEFREELIDAYKRHISVIREIPSFVPDSDDEPFEDAYEKIPGREPPNGTVSEGGTSDIDADVISGPPGQVGFAGMGEDTGGDEVVYSPPADPAPEIPESVDRRTGYSFDAEPRIPKDESETDLEESAENTGSPEESLGDSWIPFAVGEKDEIAAANDPDTAEQFEFIEESEDTLRVGFADGMPTRENTLTFESSGSGRYGFDSVILEDIGSGDAKKELPKMENTGDLYSGTGELGYNIPLAELRFGPDFDPKK